LRLQCFGKRKRSRVKVDRQRAWCKAPGGEKRRAGRRRAGTSAQGYQRGKFKNLVRKEKEALSTDSSEEERKRGRGRGKTVVNVVNTKEGVCEKNAVIPNDWGKRRRRKGHTLTHVGEASCTHQKFS